MTLRRCGLVKKNHACKKVSDTPHEPNATEAVWKLQTYIWRLCAARSTFDDTQLHTASSGKGRPSLSPSNTTSPSHKVAGQQRTTPQQLLILRAPLQMLPQATIAANPRMHDSRNMDPSLGAPRPETGMRQFVFWYSKLFFSRTTKRDVCHVIKMQKGL